MSNLVIRPMTQEDITTLCLADGGETPDNRECYERYFNWQSQEKDCVFLLALLDKQVVGHLFVFFHDDPSLGQGMDLPRLADLFVYEPFRNQGVAAALLSAGEQLAGTICDRVFLTVQSEHPIKQAYERRDYRLFGEYGDELTLIKQLN